MTASPPAIRAATAEDAPAIAQLIADVASEFILAEVTPEARALFLATHDSTAIARFINGSFRYHIAECAGRIVGVVGVRDNAHLYSLFVSKPFQGQGVGRRLWQHAVQECLGLGNPGAFTVNSSLNAVAAYARLGFSASDGAQVRDGISFVPMNLNLTAGTADASRRID